VADSPIRGTPLADLNESANIEDAVNPGLLALDDAPRWARGSQAGAASTGTRRFYEATDTGRLYMDIGSGLVEIPLAPIGPADLADGAVTPAKHGQAPSVRVELNAAVSIANNTSTLVSWTTTRFEDEATMFEGTVGLPNVRLNVTVAGVYVVTAVAAWASASGSDRRAQLYHTTADGVTTALVAEDDRLSIGSGRLTRQPVSGIWRAAVGDYFTMKVTQWSGGALNLETDSHLAIARMGS
jgi:hypothetical protein